MNDAVRWLAIEDCIVSSFSRDHLVGAHSSSDWRVDAYSNCTENAEGFAVKQANPIIN